MRNWAWPLILFGLAGAIRCATWWPARGDPALAELVGDAARYHAWAGQIAAGDWLSRSEGVFYQPPLYPYFLALHAAAFGESAPTAARVTQIALGSLSAVLLATAAGRLVGGGKPGAVAAGVAGVIWAAQPAAVFFDLQIDKAAIDGFLICLILCLTATAIDRPQPWLSPALGAAVGLLSLSRENGMILLAAVVPLAWHNARRRADLHRRRNGWLLPLLTIGAFLALMAPVTIRNHLVGGEWHLTTSQFGPNFYIGNARDADGLYRPLVAGRGDPRFERSDAVELAERARGESLSPREVSRYWAGRAWADIAEAPGRWLRLLARKWLMTVHAAEIADNNDIDAFTVASPPLRLLDGMLHAGVIAPLAVAGAILAWPDRRRWGWVAVMAVLMSMVVALFYLFARYRYPLLPMLVVIIAAGAGALARGAIPIQRWVVAAGLGLAAAVACNAAVIVPERARGADHYHRGLAWQGRGQSAAAELAYRRALSVHPELEPAHTNLGLLLAKRGAYDAAITHLSEAARLRPDDPATHNNLGMALGGRGNLPAAIACFKQALRVDPTYEPARRNLIAAEKLPASQP